MSMTQVRGLSSCAQLDEQIRSSGEKQRLAMAVEQPGGLLQRPGAS
jgi:hypothetical protein